jgi:DNA-binding LytR/AlgR family response regulator
MKLFIAEDEEPARERLIETIFRVAPDAMVVGHATSVADTRRWLATHDEPDVLMLDIQLADGLSLELFTQGRSAGALEGALTLPTIFTTAYDEYAVAAFRALAIAYLLKPVGDEPLAQAFARLRSLRQRFSGQAAEALMARLQSAPRHRQRWLARKGAAFVAVPVQQVAWFVSLDKLTFVVTQAGERLLLDDTLAEVEASLDDTQFFRINRQVIVAASAVRRFSPAGKGRLNLEVAPAHDGPLQVPQERAAAFRLWLGR